MAEKNSAQTNRQTNRHYENNGHLAVNQLMIYQRSAKIYAVFFSMQTMPNYTNMFYKMRIILIHRLL